MDKYNKELLIHVIFGIVALIITYFFGGKKEINMYAVILAYILITTLIVWFKSRFNSDKEQNLLYSFWTDDLIPNKERKILDFKTEVVFIEHPSENSILEKYIDEFKDINGLKLIHISTTSINETDIQRKLSGAESVIIVRSEELENFPQIYSEVESWASKNSQSPCLVIDKINKEENKSIQLNPIPERYFFIPDDPKSLSWRLIQRANERASLWRKQAGFNRFAAFVVGITLVSSLTIIGIKLISKGKEKENFVSYRNIYENISEETKEFYEKTVLKESDPTLSLSYWIEHEGKLFRMGTSEKNSSYKSLPNDKNSVVGCSFAYPNNFATNINIDSNNIVQLIRLESLQTRQNTDCKFMTEDSRFINKIVCASYNKETNITVGICLDTKNEQNLTSEESLNFLKNRTKVFFEAIYPRISNDELYPIE